VESRNEKILLVDDEIYIRKLLTKRLTAAGYKVFSAADGKEGLDCFIKNQPDLVILDIILSKLDGYEVCRKIRKNSDVPIIILTALGSISNRLVGLELGADDYMVKPFSPKELEARIKAILRRSDFKARKLIQKKTKSVKISNWSLDPNTRVISKNNSKIKLTDIEFNLLQLLIKNAGSELSRLDILNNVWGYIPERYIDTRVVDVHISRLRSKIEKDPSNPDLILTIRGKGYMFQNY
jgi:OmpR family response regulator RpaB